MRFTFAAVLAALVAFACSSALAAPRRLTTRDLQSVYIRDELSSLYLRDLSEILDARDLHFEIAGVEKRMFKVPSSSPGPAAGSTEGHEPMSPLEPPPPRTDPAAFNSDTRHPSQLPASAQNPQSNRPVQVSPLNPASHTGEGGQASG
ncbi:hypothetical protein EIP91_009138 [Steccherinum ochraceum]|uniref:Uncharacterized protein n=1 Tax=Steccherinum ochraceum TaxID=92696 RepID=A0A4R0RF48_9APHY|nr:hypothetical protein EIP91_009138 [Steccherinum ochraceum]